MCDRTYFREEGSTLVSECLVVGHAVLSQNDTVLERVVAAICHGASGRKLAQGPPAPAAFHLLKYPASPKTALPVGPNKSLGDKDTHIKAPEWGYRWTRQRLRYSSFAKGPLRCQQEQTHCPRSNGL